MAGQIIRRGERTWLVRVFLGRDPETGKRRYHSRTVRGSKRDAQQYLNGVLRDRDLGIYAVPARLTLNDYLNRWLDSAVKPRVRERTALDYTDKLNRYVRPTLGACRLDQITPLQIQALYADLQGRGLSGRTVRYVHALLKAAFKQAVRWGLLARNPAEMVDPPRQERREMRALSPEEAARFLAAAEQDSLGIVFTFALATGLRPGEYLALRWQDFDPEAGTVHVRRTVGRIGGSWRFDEPKTARSRRVVPLPPSLTRALLAHRRRQAEERLRAGPAYEPLDLIFATETGRPLDARNLANRNLKRILRAAGLPENLRLYDLRHSCATLLLSANENPKIVAERLGHTTTRTTLDVYSHVLPHMQQRAADHLERILFERQGRA